VAVKSQAAKGHVSEAPSTSASKAYSVLRPQTGQVKGSLAGFSDMSKFITRQQPYRQIFTI
jgi:hypothetical protein